MSSSFNFFSAFSASPHELTDLLGEDHHLAVLKRIAEEDGDGKPSVDDELLFALLDERRGALQEEAKRLGEKLYRETPGEFVRRLHGYWKSARSKKSP